MSRPKSFLPWRCLPHVPTLCRDLCIRYIPRDQMISDLVLVFNLRPGCLIIARNLNVHQLTSLARVGFDVTPDLAAQSSPRSLCHFSVLANLDFLFHQDFLFHWVKDFPLFVSWAPLLYDCVGKLHLVLSSVFFCICHHVLKLLSGEIQLPDAFLDR
jgi:hypothetical protein